MSWLFNWQRQSHIRLLAASYERKIHTASSWILKLLSSSGCWCIIWGQNRLRRDNDGVIQFYGRRVLHSRLSVGLFRRWIDSLIEVSWWVHPLNRLLFLNDYNWLCIYLLDLNHTTLGLRLWNYMRSDLIWTILLMSKNLCK
jgi:hypothetical protein